MPLWERLVRELDELDRQAHAILQKEFPDDEDIPDLPLTDITLDKAGCYGAFSLCYDAGDSPAGSSTSMCPLTSGSYPARRWATTPFDLTFMLWGGVLDGTDFVHRCFLAWRRKD